jgi:transposase InsO family protein
VSSELGKWLNGIRHIRGRPYHPDDAGQDRAISSLDEKPDPAGQLLPARTARTVEEFVRYYNNCRYHESLDNPTPPDVYLGRGQAILERREKIKRKTIELKTPPASAGKGTALKRRPWRR